MKTTEVEPKKRLFCPFLVGGSLTREPLQCLSPSTRLSPHQFKTDPTNFFSWRHLQQRRRKTTISPSTRSTTNLSVMPFLNQIFFFSAKCRFFVLSLLNHNKYFRYLQICSQWFYFNSNQQNFMSSISGNKSWQALGQTCGIKINRVGQQVYSILCTGKRLLWRSYRFMGRGWERKRDIDHGK